MFKIEQITELAQNRLSELDALTNTFTLNMNYRHKDVAETVGFDYLTINDVDYTEQANSQPTTQSTSMPNETFSHKRIFRVSDVPLADACYIKRKITREEDLPIYRSVFGLKYPAKRVHFHFRIAGDEKDNWRILSNFAVPFKADLKSEKNYIQSITDESVDITVNEWCLRGSGFMLVIIPKKENWDYWK